MTSNTDLEAMKVWQESFYRGIFNPTTDNIDNACVDVKGSEVLSAQDRLTIYRGSILGGITTALMGIFPVCLKLVGEQFFTHMVAGYLRKYPSGSPDLGDYGANLGDYLDDFITSRDSTQQLVYLPDSARLEWLWHQAFNAGGVEGAQSQSQSLEELALIDDEQQGNIIFKLDPSIGVMESAYPVDEIWRLNQENSDEMTSVDLDVGGSCLMVQRNANFDMVISTLSHEEFQFLNSIYNGISFAQIAEIEFQSTVSELLAMSIQSGLIVGFSMSV
jgi:hypothetical protein